MDRCRGACPVSKHHTNTASRVTNLSNIQQVKAQSTPCIHIHVCYAGFTCNAIRYAKKKVSHDAVSWNSQDYSSRL